MTRVIELAIPVSSTTASEGLSCPHEWIRNSSGLTKELARATVLRDVQSRMAAIDDFNWDDLRFFLLDGQYRE